jgi:hypothetical protein
MVMFSGIAPISLTRPMRAWVFSMYRSKAALGEDSKPSFTMEVARITKPGWNGTTSRSKRSSESAVLVPALDRLMTRMPDFANCCASLPAQEALWLEAPTPSAVDDPKITTVRLRTSGAGVRSILQA